MKTKRLRASHKRASHTLRKRIHRYISQKQDICCEEDYDRVKIANLILNQYQEHYKDDYLDWVDNDMVKFIGYRNELVQKKDYEGVKLWDALGKSTQGNDRNKFIKVLTSLPLYVLLSFLGTATYLNKA